MSFEILTFTCCPFTDKSNSQTTSPLKFRLLYPGLIDSKRMFYEVPKKKHPVAFATGCLKVTYYSFVSSSEGVVSTMTTSVCSTGNTGSEVLVSILR